MPTTIRLTSKVLSRVPTQQCYWKSRWGVPWEAAPSLWCSGVEWSAAPSLPVGQFRWEYGVKLPPGVLSFAPQFRENNRIRFFVKVVYSIYAPGTDDSNTDWTWVGVIDIDLDEVHGPLWEKVGDDVFVYAKGVNHFTAYGVESLLDYQRVGTSLVAGTPASGPYWVKRGLSFNHQGIDQHVLGNRSDAELTAGGFAFHGLRTGGKAWSTRTAVDYLIRQQTPADNSGTPQIPFQLSDPTHVLPDWDEPVLPTQGRTTRELLNALIARQRLRGYWCDVEEPVGLPAFVRVRPFSFADLLLALPNPSGAYIPANSDQIILAFERDRGATCTVKNTAADRYDRVVAIGARRTSTATWSWLDGTLVEGWPSALEVLYEEGASTAAGYPGAADIELSARMNADARKADKLRPVYARFVMPDPFGYVVGDGLGEPDEWLTPTDNPEDDTFVRIAPEDRQWLPHLAIRAGFDYSDTAIAEAAVTAHAPGAHHWLEPLVLFRRYDWTEETPTYRHAESVAINAESELEGPENLQAWQANVHVDHEDGSLWVKLSAYQHDIAVTAFAALDEDQEVGSSDYQEMICTLTVAWSEYVEMPWPDELPFGYDIIRTLYIDAGDDYRLDYAVPGTAVALTPETGEVLRTTGGYFRDDRKQLEGLARQAYEWYSETRRVVSLETTTIDTRLTLGQLVLTVGDPDIEGDLELDVYACITSIRLDSPLAQGTGPVQPSPVRMTLQTAYGELDPLTLGARHK